MTLVETVKEAAQGVKSAVVGTQRVSTPPPSPHA